MIQNINIKHFSCLYHFFCYFYIFRTWFNISAWVIMKKHDISRIIINCNFKNFPWMNNT